MVDRDAAQQRLVIELYVLGGAPTSETALANLKRICDRRLGGRAFDLQIIDVLEHPQAAEDARVTATPTLVRRAPAPVAYVVGDLSATEVVLRVLGIDDDDDNDNDNDNDVNNVNNVHDAGRPSNRGQQRNQRENR